ncbi:nickel uptake transporter family protein [Pseudomonas sp. Marseille-QA0892]
MFKKTLACLGLSALATLANAHELWVEEDANGVARVYIGEPEEGPDAGEAVQNMAAGAKVFTTKIDDAAPVTVKHDHLEAKPAGTGDIRVVNDGVWKPWKNEDGTYTAPLMHARYGRTDPQAAMDFELVPTTAGADRFTLTFKGEPLANHDVAMFGPEQGAKPIELKTDGKGIVEAPVKGRGRFIIAANHNAAANGASVDGQKVDRYYYGTTTTFNVE